MIKLRNVNKYFNYKKRNQIHVANNISLDFPTTGLVCLLGPSGSGKTTLLNLISGLDKAHSGSIEIDGRIVEKEKDWTYLRNYKFGYIFQNYLLLPEFSVYENLEFSLKPYKLSIEEVERRIDYALRAVGMEKFKYRMPSELSGGQQQRISVARALIKSPDIYIADEPTGNIDEKNTTQVMNILKKLSVKSLVILVTHERRLAEFYGDRIIEIKDGLIIRDYENDAKAALKSFDDNNLYLQEFEKTSNDLEDIEINYFYQEQNKNKLKIDVIFKNNTYYIQANGGKQKVEFLDDTSEVKVIDAKIPELNIEDALKTEFHLEKIGFEKDKFSSALSFKDKVRMSYNNIRNLKFIQKIMLFIFFVASIFFTYGITMYNDSNFVDEKSFLTYHRDLIRIESKHLENLNELNELKAITKTDYLIPHYNLTRITSIYVDEFYQRNQQVYITTPSVFPLDTISEEKIMYGRLPNNPYEIVLDSYLADELLKLNEIRNLGIKLPEQFIGLAYTERFANYTIVGIVKNNNPIMYLNSEGYKLFALNKALVRENNLFVLYDDAYLKNINIFKAGIEEKANASELELSENQILVSQKLAIDLEGRNLKVGGFEYEVVGTYQTDISYETSFYIQKQHLDKIYDIAMLMQDDLFIVSGDKVSDIKRLEEHNFKVYDVYDTHYDARLILDKNYTALFYSSIFVLFSLIFLYFIMRSSVASRTYTIGVFRALGVSRQSIFKLFLIEIGLITLISSLTGVILVSIVISRVNSIYYLIYYPLYVPIVTFALIYLLNSLIGILPVLPYLRKTPAEILSKYDF